MGDEEWFPPGEAAMGRGEDEPAPVLIGDEVLWVEKALRPKTVPSN